MQLRATQWIPLYFTGATRPPSKSAIKKSKENNIELMMIRIIMRNEENHKKAYYAHKQIK